MVGTQEYEISKSAGELIGGLASLRIPGLKLNPSYKGADPYELMFNRQSYDGIKDITRGTRVARIQGVGPSAGIVEAVGPSIWNAATLATDFTTLGALLVTACDGSRKFFPRPACTNIVNQVGDPCRQGERVLRRSHEHHRTPAALRVPGPCRHDLALPCLGHPDALLLPLLTEPW